MTDTRKENLLFDARFIKLKEVEDSRFKNRYIFAERLGVNSIAFVCYDKKRNQFLLNFEYKPPIDEFILGAFGGSIDKNVSMIDIVKDEVREEAGFEIENTDIEYLGKVFVSTQMNQYCRLYLAYVDRDKQKERKPENAVEAMASTEWVDYQQIIGLSDWKAIAIVAKAKSQGVV